MPNAWINHVMLFHKKHPQLTYKQALIAAKSSYGQKGGNPLAVLGAVAQPIADVVGSIAVAADKGAERNYEKSKLTKKYDKEKSFNRREIQRKTLEHYNSLKSQRKKGRLPPGLESDVKLWEYALDTLSE